MYTKNKINVAYVSKHNVNCGKQVIHLMVPNGDGWHYIAVKQLLALLSEITSKTKVIFMVWIAFIFFITENKIRNWKQKLKSHKEVCENKDFCNVVMPSEDTKMLELNQFIFMQIFNV